jgi:hypothetical protein
MYTRPRFSLIGGTPIIFGKKSRKQKIVHALINVPWYILSARPYTFYNH